LVEAEDEAHRFVQRAFEALDTILAIIVSPVDGEAEDAAPLAAPPGRLTLTVAEAAELLGISRGLAYEAVRRGEISSLQIGHRILVPRAAIMKMLDVGPPASSQGPS
jgi:excisionase family DNA binding protein